MHNSLRYIGTYAWIAELTLGYRDVLYWGNLGFALGATPSDDLARLPFASNAIARAPVARAPRARPSTVDLIQWRRSNS